MSNVVAAKRGCCWAEGPSKEFASIWRSLRCTNSDFASVISGVLHVKAHRAWSAVNATDAMDVLDFKGNAAVDRLARHEGLLLHPNVCDAKDQLLAFDNKLGLIARHIAVSLALFPSYSKLTAGLQLTPAGARPIVRFARKDFGHSMAWNGTTWCCTCCYACSTFPSGPRFVCVGHHELFSHLIQDNKGHRLSLVTTQHGDPVVFCNYCGCYSEARVRWLTKPCGVAPTRHGKSALARIGRFRHPNAKGLHVSRPARLCLPPKAVDIALGPAFSISACH